MATARAATASPTHRDSSPATSPPPYPSAARIADSACFPQYTASLKCLEANQHKSKCQQQFDDYKECKKKEMDKRRLKRRKLLFFGAAAYVATCMTIFYIRSRLRNRRDRITYGPIEDRDRVRIDYLNNKRVVGHGSVEEVTMSATCGGDSSASKPPKRAKLSTDDDLYSFMTTGIERLAKAIEKAGTADTDVPEDLWDSMMDLPGFEEAHLTHYYAHLCENVSLTRAFNKLSLSNNIVWVARYISNNNL